MVLREETEEAYKRLSVSKSATVGELPFLFFLRRVHFGTAVHINTLVYQGDRFVPQGVREVASHPIAEMQRYLRTWLIIDEENYQISLHCTEIFTSDFEKFSEILSEFEDVAMKWRDIFEERDRQDLVYIPIQSR